MESSSCDEISVISVDESEELDFMPLTKKRKCELIANKFIPCVVG